MMRILIDFSILAILALCTWGGFKRGLIGSIAGILVVIVALYGGTLLSRAYSGEVIPALEPFVDGYVDSQQSRETIVNSLKSSGLVEESSDRSLDDILAADSSLRIDYAYLCMKMLGFNDDRSLELSADAVRLANSDLNMSMTDAIVDTLCETITYVVGLLLAFLMILIAILAIANLTNLSFRLPNMENLDEIGGAVLGFTKGFLYCVLLCWVLSFAGLIVGRDTVDASVLTRFFLSFQFITGSLL